MKKYIFTFLLNLILIQLNFAQSNIDVSAEIRPRFQIDNKDFNSGQGADSYTELRTRLGVLFSADENISGLFQIQDSRVYGTENSTLSDMSNIDLHQAYFEIKNFFDLPLNLKLGRMELSFGPQRLIGAVGWSNVGRSFDGGVLKLNTDKYDVDFFSAKIAESSQPGDTNDFSLLGFYGNIKSSNNYKIQPFIIGEFETGTDFNRYTAGIYVNGNLGNLSHELEGAYQFGSMSETVDIAAYMFALNLNYSFIGDAKPAFGIGIDYLSGDDGEDTEKYKVFNTLYATNHKYYGYMDFFINIPANTLSLGLMDVHAKAEISPIEKLKTAIAFHIFNSNEDFRLPDDKTSNSFGSEIDLTLIYSYNQNVKFQGGFSFFTPGEIFEQSQGKDSSSWTYIMAIVNLE